jgi:hypothetical protein
MDAHCRGVRCRHHPDVCQRRAGQHLRIFSRALSAGEIRSLYTGSSPVLAFFFEEPWATDGTIVPDSSGWAQNGTLFTGTAAAANKAVPGQSGSYGLQLDGVDDYVRVPDHPILDFAHDQDFAVALWVKADTQVNTQHSDNDIVEKWAGSGGYPYVIRYLRASGTIVAARYDGSHNPMVSSQIRIDDGQFHHVAFVKQGATLYLYVDGVQRATRRIAPPCTSAGGAIRATTSQARSTICASTPAPCLRWRWRTCTTPAGRPRP